MSDSRVGRDHRRPQTTEADAAATLSRLMGEVAVALGPVRQGRSPDRRAAAHLTSQLDRYWTSRPPVADYDPPVRVSDLDLFLDAVRGAYESETERAAALLQAVTAAEDTDLFEPGRAVSVTDFHQLRNLRGFHDALRRVVGVPDRLTPLLAAAQSSIERRVRRSLEATVALSTDADAVLAGLRAWIVNVRALFGDEERGPVRHGLAVARAEIQLRVDWLYLEPDYADRVAVDRGGYDPVLGLFVDGVRLRLASAGRQLSRGHQRCVRHLDAVLARPATATGLTRCTQSRLRAARSLHAAALSAKSAIEALVAQINAWPESGPGPAAPDDDVADRPGPAADLPKPLRERMRADVRAFALLRRQCGIVRRLAPSDESGPVSVADLAEIAAGLYALYRSCSASDRAQLRLLERTYHLGAGRTLRTVKESVDVVAICAGAGRGDRAASVDALSVAVRTLLRCRKAVPGTWARPIAALAERLGVRDGPVR